MLLCIPECKNLESWCNYEPKCDNDDVREQCPKWCGTCEGKEWINCSHKTSR